MVDRPAQLGARRLVAGIGEPMRSDDGAGPRVVRELRGQVAPDVQLVERVADPTRLLELWRGRELAIVVDASRSGAELGTVRRVEATELTGSEAASLTSSHGFSFRETLELGRALGILPERLVLVLVEAGDLGRGASLSPEVARGVREAARRVEAELSRPALPITFGG